MSKKPTRMEQLGALMTAMVAVIVGGSSGLTGNGKRGAPSRRVKVSRRPIPEAPEVGIRGKYYGLASRVARKLGVSDDSVWRAIWGKNGNARILAAIRAEILIMDAPGAIRSPRAARSTAQCWGLPAADLAELRCGGRYYGICRRTARAIGCANSNVNDVAHGRWRSAVILAALRAEMARVDAELAAKKAGA